MRHWKHLSMACMTVLAAAVGVGAADYETPKNRSVKDVLPRRSPRAPTTRSATRWWRTATCISSRSSRPTPCST